MKTIVITSTGRCGTTFLVLLYNFLGFKTGFTEKKIKQYIFPNCNSGLEFSEECIGNLEIVKSPSYLNKMDKLDLKKISWVIVPIRDFSEAAKSRAHYGSEAGGMIGGATNWLEQKNIFEKSISKYVQDMTKFDIPTIFLDFYEMVKTPEYLFKKISITFKKEISYEFFLECYQKASKLQDKRTKYDI